MNKQDNKPERTAMQEAVDIAADFERNYSAAEKKGRQGRDLAACMVRKQITIETMEAITVIYL